MWRRKSWRFYFGLPPYGFYFHGFKPFPSKEEYLDLLEEYRKELHQELEEVENELAEIKRNP